MTNKINRIKAVFVGFFLIIIPIYFFIYSLDDLYSSSKEKTLETLRQSILVYAKKVEDRMNPLQYLESELSKIHTDLIPDFPNKIISGIPDKNVISQVYNKKVFSKLLSLTKDRFAPILIIFGTNNFEEIYSYCSPELNSDFESLKDKNTLLRIKTRYDLEILRNKYINFFKPQTFPRLKEIYNRPDDTIIINNRNKDPCYRYLSRYKRLKNNYATIYTDYFNKQCLYPILLYTFSQYGVHGYYSLLVPQSHVDPNDIIKSVLSDKNLDVKISLESNKFQYQLNDTHEGIQYHLDFPPFFINHIKTFELLGGTVDSDLLGKHFKLSLDYPNDLLYLKKLVSVSKKAGIIICILYTIISIWLLKNTKQYNILITRKITCVLSIVILFPIIAIMIFVHLSVQNLDEYIIYNVSKTMHNQLEMHKIQDEENTTRWLSSIYEIKKRLSKTELRAENLFNGILTEKEAQTWFFDRYNGLLALSDKNEIFAFKDTGLRERSHEIRFYKQLLGRYINNLGIAQNSINYKSFIDSKMTQYLSLGILEEYFSLGQEELTLPQESVPNKDILNAMKKRYFRFLSCKRYKKNELCVLYKKNQFKY